MAKQKKTKKSNNYKKKMSRSELKDRKRYVNKSPKEVYDIRLKEVLEATPDKQGHMIKTMLKNSFLYNNGLNLLKHMYEPHNYEKIKPLMPIFKASAIRKWKKVSGADYRNNIDIKPSLYTNRQRDAISPSHIKKILKYIDQESTTNLSYKPKHTFVFPQTQKYDELKFGSEKKVIGLMFQDAYIEEHDENNLAINLILTEKHNPKHIFSARFIVRENYAVRDMEFGVYINGLPKGYKLLERIDDLGLQDPQLLENLKLDTPDLKLSLLNKQFDKYRHINYSNHIAKDKQVVTKTTGTINQIHHATKFNDEMICAGKYLINNLNLSKNLKIDCMPAQDYDVYRLNSSPQEVYSKMKQDSLDYGYLIPFERSYETFAKRFNITTPVFTPQFFKEINDGMTIETQYHLPRVDRMLHDAVKYDGIVKNIENIVYVQPQSKNKLKPIDPNYRFANPIEHNIKKREYEYEKYMKRIRSGDNNNHFSKDETAKTKKETKKLETFDNVVDKPKKGLKNKQKANKETYFEKKQRIERLTNPQNDELLKFDEKVLMNHKNM